MRTDPSAAVIRTSGHPLLRFLSSFPIACFTGALVTDFTYWRSANVMWSDFSAWLLAAGELMGCLAALVGLILLVVSRAARAHRPLWPLLLGSVVVLVVGFADNLVHSRDGWTSVVPLGLILSACTVLLVLITLWLGTGMRELRVVVNGYAGARP